MMKKSVVAACVLLAISQASFATTNRINALGNSTAMIQDDDTNIDLFPQTINRQNFMRLSGINTGTPDYAILTGTPGDKWGLYGGTVQKNDFLNIYRSMGNDAALKLGVKFGRHSVEASADSNETTVAKSDSKNSFFDLGLDATYGFGTGDRETAIKGYINYGPNSIRALPTVGDVGTYEDSVTSGATTTKRDGEGNNFSFGGILSVRQPMQVAMFSKVFGSIGLSYASQSSSLSSGAAKVEDYSESGVALFASALLFDEKKIADRARVFYGLGASASISRASGKNKTNLEETKLTIFRLTGPQIRLGLETDIKYGKLRFGISREIDIFSYEKNAATPKSGANNDNNSDTTFDLVRNGAYRFAAGYGMEYQSLKIDITLMNDVWVRGPQKLFSGAAGPLGASADVIYTY